jgi:very-short-patch-repair endonuclease
MELQALQTKWRSLSGGSSSPTTYKDQPSVEKAVLSVKSEREDLQKIVGTQGWEKLGLGQLVETIERYACDSVTPYRMFSLSEIEAKLRDLGVQRLVDDLRQRKCSNNYWVATFDHCLLTSALDEMALKNPEIRSFVGSTHGQYVEEFKQLDTDRLKLARDRVRRIHAEQTIAAMNAHPDQEALIKQEAAKMRRFKPLRKVFEEAGDVMMAVCPCWMASPLSVAQLIHTNLKFDYVIFDEASQILPEDAISAVMRGKYAIVAGDNKQLPPTGFFAAASDDEDIETAAIGYESLLDMMLPFARGFHLNWHYRSRDEALIAFSNHWMYDDRLVTFPGVGGPPAVRHVLVSHIPEGDGQEESSSAEVQRVVDLVLRHAEDQPDKSLGVISMGIKHAMRIQGALDQAQAKRPELAEFFDPGRTDRFFVKNLERVQGDERDCIILSVGYGKDRAGNLPLRFGPILAAGGMRRLNVAVTRARESMTLVSSFAHTDIDTTKVREGTGLEFLRNYLQYAASNGAVFAHGEISNEPMNDFEADIYEALTARGLKLVPQVGCSSFRIDFGVCHPSEPGRFVLAIEADGASYHSSCTARDRDRLRQQMLENLGWRFHRIWSTDWFQRKHEEIERTMSAFDRALTAVAERGAIVPERSPVEEAVPDLPMQELRGRRSSIFPPIPKRTSIADYTSNELRELYNWVTSDGHLRTHDEIADEMFTALPFSRRGSRIEGVLRDTIRRCEQIAQRS